MATAVAGAAARIVGAAAVGILVATLLTQGDPVYDLPDVGVVAAVQELAGRHDHGPADNGTNLDAVAVERRIQATCGYVSSWAVQVLRREGFEARVVDTLTLEEWDDRNNGHTMLEAKVDGRWVLFDVDRDVWFWRDGEPLSLIDVFDGDYGVRRLADDPVPAGQIVAENERLFQVPGIRVGDETVFFSDHPDRVLGYSDAYVELPEAEWRERFYT